MKTQRGPKKLKNATKPFQFRLDSLGGSLLLDCIEPSPRGFVLKSDEVLGATWPAGPPAAASKLSDFFQTAGESGPLKDALDKLSESAGTLIEKANSFLDR